MEEKLLEIRYEMNLGEIETGFRLFQRKYQFKRCIIYTIVYAIALVLGIDLIIRNVTGIYGYILTGLSLGLIFYCWYKPVQIRKKMITTISSLAEEKYITEIYPSRIQITTQIEESECDCGEAENETPSDEKHTDDRDNSAEGDASESSQKTENVVTNLYFGSDYLEAMEHEEMFLLFVNKRLIYIYPKRCLSDDEQGRLRDILTEKAVL